MSEPRAASGLLVFALVRLVEAKGGSAMVLAKGDATAGAILLALADRGVDGPLLERSFGPGGYEWRETGPADLSERTTYLANRRRTDPDLWIVEIDHADARTIALELLA
ncbi:DUF1491 family protein [Sphingomonas sp. BIUV-7]|uniref:DUF1491 family protein n=1 Tax=Sphingomonas natans TaxID=3063330 RepID=A0ABT8YDH5_9SPHN|nr:DUF1491 family protein [Sphingomonas sp. BIUV-7]MDO6415992.1 DUF1491 family protein [Sphingomonas sp. BIUV-7]